jgi:hypothetical protein
LSALPVGKPFKRLWFVSIGPNTGLKSCVTKSLAHYYSGAFCGEEAVSKTFGIGMTKAMVDAASAKEKWRTVFLRFQIYVGERQ